jgi:uncharacterized OB-fold protein
LLKYKLELATGGNTMGKVLHQGETLAVPCRHCGKLSIQGTVKAGEAVLKCSHCQKPTKLTARLATGEWRVWTEALSEVAAQVSR